MSIDFAGLGFSDPVALPSFRGAPLPALYCFSVVDSSWAPKPFRPVYFGETNNSASKIDLRHAAIERWQLMGRNVNELYVSVYYVPYVPEIARRHAETVLIEKFRTSLNGSLLASEGRLGLFEASMLGLR